MSASRSRKATSSASNERRVAERMDSEPWNPGAPPTTTASPLAGGPSAATMPPKRWSVRTSSTTSGLPWVMTTAWRSAWGSGWFSSRPASVPNHAARMVGRWPGAALDEHRRVDAEGLARGLHHRVGDVDRVEGGHRQQGQPDDDLVAADLDLEPVGNDDGRVDVRAASSRGPVRRRLRSDPARFVGHGLADLRVRVPLGLRLGFGSGSGSGGSGSGSAARARLTRRARARLCSPGLGLGLGALGRASWSRVNDTSAASHSSTVTASSVKPETIGLTRASTPIVRPAAPQRQDAHRAGEARAGEGGDAEGGLEGEVGHHDRGVEADGHRQRLVVAQPGRRARRPPR